MRNLVYQQNAIHKQKGPSQHNAFDHQRNTGNANLTSNWNPLRTSIPREEVKMAFNDIVERQKGNNKQPTHRQKINLNRRNNFDRWNNLKPTSSKMQQRSISNNSKAGIHNKTLNTLRSQQIVSNLEEINYFSDDLIDIISNQQAYIIQFRKKLQFDKNKASTDIQLFKKEIVNMIQDYRLSVLAEMDEIFKQYIQMYSKIKHNLHDIKNTKEQIKRDLQTKESNRSFSIDNGFNRSRNKSINSTKISNQQKLKSYLQKARAGDSKLSSLPMVIDNNMTIIKAIQENNDDFRKYYILKYIDDMQKEKVNEVQVMADQIIILNQFDNGFYITQEMEKLLVQCKNHLKAFWNNMYKGNRPHLRTISQILSKSKTGPIVQQDHTSFQNINAPQSQFDLPEYSGNPQLITQKNQKKYQNLQKKYQSYQQQQYQPYKQYQPQQYQSQKYQHPQYQQIHQPNHQISNTNTYHSQTTQHIIRVKISPSQQVSELHGLQIGSIKHAKCLKLSHSKEISLCTIMLPTGQLAIGSRDGSIGIYNIQNSTITQRLQGHRASVCTLAVIKSYEMSNFVRYLASGSDHDCNSIILWDLNDWSIKCKIESHRAAVTGILDLQDGYHFLSGSYDKKINIYEVGGGKVKYNLPTNKSSVTGVTMNSLGNKVISCGLDNTINIWQVSRRNNSNFTINQIGGFSLKNVVQTLFLERIIQNNTMICSLLASTIRNQIIYLGTKDGKIKIIDISLGQCQKTINCSQDGAALIQMLVIERQNKPKNPIIIAFPCQQPLIRIVDTQLQSIRDFNFKSGCYLQFGCGVGPKCILFNSRKRISFGVLTHGAHKQFNVYEINV